MVRRPSGRFVPHRSALLEAQCRFALPPSCRLCHAWCIAIELEMFAVCGTCLKYHHWAFGESARWGWPYPGIRYVLRLLGISRLEISTAS